MKTEIKTDMTDMKKYQVARSPAFLYNMNSVNLGQRDTGYALT